MGWGLEDHREQTRPVGSLGGAGKLGGTRGKQDALRSSRITHRTYHFLQLKDQSGGPVPQRFTLRSWNVAAGSPTWILLELPQSRHPTTTIITITVTPASRKPACSQKLSRLPSKWHISLPPPVTLALRSLPGWGFLSPGCPGCPGCWL